MWSARRLSMTTTTTFIGPADCAPAPPARSRSRRETSLPTLDSLVTVWRPMARTWVLTGSLDNFRATRDHGFRVIGAKEGRRGMAEQIEPGDRIAFYVTGVQAFGGIVRVTGEMYEDRTKIWPGKPGRVDAYPWRFETEPEVVLEEDDFVPAVEVAAELDHVKKWPAEHWHLAFQGQLRTVSDVDAELLESRIRAGAGAAA